VESLKLKAERIFAPSRWLVNTPMVRIGELKVRVDPPSLYKLRRTSG
jgi:hypothetical protein